MIDFGIWDKLQEHEVANMIYTGAKNFNELQPSYGIIKEIGIEDYRYLLDFGCGMGRNLAGMARLGKKCVFIGYDNPSMISFAKNYVVNLADEDKGRIKLFSDWNEVIEVSAIYNKFDTIFCCFVLQHIPEAQLRWYLDQFKLIGNELFVFGRRALDPSNIVGYDGGDNFTSVWDVILNSGFEIIGAQDGFTESSSGFNKGNGNDHHWVRFRPKGKNKNHVRAEKRRFTFSKE